MLSSVAPVNGPSDVRDRAENDPRRRGGRAGPWARASLPLNSATGPRYGLGGPPSCLLRSQSPRADAVWQARDDAQGQPADVVLARAGRTLTRARRQHQRLGQLLVVVVLPLQRAPVSSAAHAQSVRSMSSPTLVRRRRINRLMLDRPRWPASTWARRSAGSLSSRAVAATRRTAADIGSSRSIRDPRNRSAPAQPPCQLNRTRGRANRRSPVAKRDTSSSWPTVPPFCRDVRRNGPG